METRLRKAEVDLVSLRQANEEIVEVNRRLRNDRKRSELSTPSRNNSVRDVAGNNNK